MAGVFPRAVVVVCLIAATFVGSASTSSSATRRSGAAVDSFERGVLAEMNAVRRTRGLRPLRLSYGLSHAAALQSRAITETGVFAHEQPGRPSFLRRLKRNYPQRGRRTWTVGENIAALTPPLAAREIVGMWLGSPSHRRTLLSRSWRDVGIGAITASAAPGVFGGDPITVVTADFGFRR
jgi:uncharacterized protein YkwD